MIWMAAAAIASSLISAKVQSDSAKRAASAQIKSADRGIEETQRQLYAAQELQRPYAEAGELSLEQQMALSGMSGQEAQREAIAAIEGGQEFQYLTRQGEDAILKNASATGGLRGGNTQEALAQFRPHILSSLINDQYARLGGVTSLGQNAASGIGNAGLQTGQNISNLYQQQGAASAGAVLAKGKVWGDTMSSIGKYAGGVDSGLFDNPFGNPNQLQDNSRKV